MEPQLSFCSFHWSSLKLQMFLINVVYKSYWRFVKCENMNNVRFLIKLSSKMWSKYPKLVALSWAKKKSLAGYTKLSRIVLLNKYIKPIVINACTTPSITLFTKVHLCIYCKNRTKYSKIESHWIESFHWLMTNNFNVYSDN